MNSMLFGRYRGRSLTTIPKTYLRWLLTQPGVRPDLRTAIKHRLGIVTAPPILPDFKRAAAGDEMEAA
jgi:hypothetical protein